MGPSLSYRPSFAIFFHLAEFRMYVASYTQSSFRSQLRRMFPAIDDRRTVIKMNFIPRSTQVSTVLSWGVVSKDAALVTRVWDQTRKPLMHNCFVTKGKSCRGETKRGSFITTRAQQAHSSPSRSRILVEPGGENENPSNHLPEPSHDNSIIS